MIPGYTGKMRKAHMTGVSLPKRQYLPCSNGLGTSRTKTRMDELIRALHSYIWAKMQNNDSTSASNSRLALDIEKVKKTTSPRRPLTAYAKCLN